MIATTLDMPESVKEFLCFHGKRIRLSPVVMKDGRLLAVYCELVPRYDEDGNMIPEDV